MSAKVTFYLEQLEPADLDKKPLLIIPVKSVSFEGDAQYVFKVIDNKVTKTEIKTGEKLGSYVEILSGLKEGEKIISEINEKIKDGIKVKIFQ